MCSTPSNDTDKRCVHCWLHTTWPHSSRGTCKPNHQMPTVCLPEWTSTGGWEVPCIQVCFWSNYQSSVRPHSHNWIIQVNNFASVISERIAYFSAYHIKRNRTFPNNFLGLFSERRRVSHTNEDWIFEPSITYEEYIQWVMRLFVHMWVYVCL